MRGVILTTSTSALMPLSHTTPVMQWSIVSGSGGIQGGRDPCPLAEAVSPIVADLYTHSDHEIKEKIGKVIKPHGAFLNHPPHAPISNVIRGRRT